MWQIVSQCLFAVNLSLPNRSALALFQDATQSVHMCHSPNEIVSYTSSGVEASWDIRIAQ